MTLKVYADRMSQPSRAIIIFCKVNGIDFEEIRMDLSKGQHRTPEFKEINPMGQVPAIVDGRFKLFESHAILLYLACAFPGVPDHWYPADLFKRAKIHSVLDWHHSNLRSGAAPLVRHSVFAPAFGLPLNPQAAAAAEKVLSLSLHVIESVWLKGNAKFLLGSLQPSIADLSLVCEIMELELLDEKDRDRILGPHVKILQWIENVKKATRPHFDDIHTILYKAKARGAHTSPSMAIEIPKVSLSTGSGAMPLVGMGTAVYPPVEPETMKAAVFHAIQTGYRHFDTASLYASEQPLGGVIAEALQLGLIKSRDELFITSKLWCTDNHPDLVLPALRKSLENLQLEYLDLFLIHWPVSMKPSENKLPSEKDCLLPMDFKSTWAALEECQTLGLTKSIGVSNFSCKKLAELLSVVKIPPAVNQVEMHPVWQQQKLREFCKMNGIHVTAYSPLGGKGTLWGGNDVMESQVLKEIAEARGKTVAQVALRWIYEQGASMVAKSFNKERMKENLQIFDWGLTESEAHLMSQIPQRRVVLGDLFISASGPYKSMEELWDGEI